MVGNSFATKRNSSKTRKCKRYEKEPQNMELRRSQRVAAKRLTIPLGFFSSGIKLTAARNNKTDFGHARIVLNEDLHALLKNFNSSPKSSSTSLEGNERFGRANSDVVFPAGILPGKKLVTREKTYQDLTEYFREVSARNPTANELVEEEVVEENNVETLQRVCSLWGVPPKKGEVPGDSQLIYEEELIENEEPSSSINISFCSNLLVVLKSTRRSHKKSYLLKVRQTARNFDDILDGKISPILQPSSSTMSTKRSLPEDYDDTNLASSAAMALVPQSQWVYSTPDKCGMKKFVFEDRNKDKMVPAVIQTTKKNKVLYDIKNEMIQNVNLTRFVKDDSVPIDKRFLNAIYQEDVSAKRVKLDEKENFFNFKEPLTKKRENNVDFNVFLSNEEKTIDIEAPSMSPMDISLPVSEESFDMNLLVEDPYEKAPVDYQHQLLMATQRPSKTTKKIPKRHMLKAKSLSFEATPPRGRPLGFEPKKLECLDEFEAQFNRLGEKNENKSEFKQPEVGGSNTTEVNLANFVVPAFKFYPRRNYDLSK